MTQSKEEMFLSLVKEVGMKKSLELLLESLPDNQADEFLEELRFDLENILANYNNRYF